MIKVVACAEQKRAAFVENMNFGTAVSLSVRRISD